MLRIALVTAALVLGTMAHAGPNGTIRVVDGDTIKVGDTTVRLHAIDAPEVDQMCGDAQSPAWPCGAWVRDKTREMFEGRTARCTATDTDRYGRVVAKCSANGRDIGETLVSEGLAFAYRDYGMDYDLTEKGAAVTARGLHGTGVMSPAAFRSAQRDAAQTDQRQAARNTVPEAINPACVIKGNISRNGESRIYHLPGQRHYDDTRISEHNGERWFCSEAEARAAGWRKARK